MAAIFRPIANLVTTLILLNLAARNLTDCSICHRSAASGVVCRSWPRTQLSLRALRRSFGFGRDALASPQDRRKVIKLMTAAFAMAGLF